MANNTILQPMKFAFFAHERLWGEEVWTAWENIKLEEKIIYLLFINHMIAILTLLELLVIKKQM